MNLNLCMAMKQHPIVLWNTNEFNRGRRSLETKVVSEGHPKSRWARKYWCRAWTDNTRSLCDIPWDSGILWHFFHQSWKRFVLVGYYTIWQSLKKWIVWCFFGKTGHVATVSLEQRRTVNSEWCTTSCLPEVFGKIRNTNMRTRIIVLFLALLFYWAPSP